MNKKQFFRLTIVLALPFFILSWWLSQQDFILERGQQITCDVEGNYCDSVYSFSHKKYMQKLILMVLGILYMTVNQSSF